MDRWNEGTDDKITQIMQRFNAMEKELRDLKVSVYQFVNQMICFRPKYNKRWTERDTQQMVRDYNLGIPIQDLAFRYGRGIGAIRARLEKVGEWKSR